MVVSMSFSQKYFYAAGIGINKSFIKLNNNNFENADKISGVTSLEVNNTYSFQKKFDSKNPLNWFRFFEVSGLVYRELAPRHFVGLKINATEMNQTYTEYPLEWNSEEKFDVAANQVKVFYPIVTTTLCYHYNIKKRFEPNAGLSVNKLFYRSEKNVFYQSNPMKSLFFTVDLGLRVSVINNLQLYANYNIGFNKIVDDKITILSPTAYGYPAANFTATNNGNSFHAGLYYNFNKPTKKHSFKKPSFNKRKGDYNTRYTMVDTNVVEVCFYDDGRNDGDAVDFYVDDHLMVANIVTDSTRKCYTLYVNNKETVLKIVSRSEGDMPPNTASILIKKGPRIYENFKYNIDDKNSLKIYLKYEEPD